MKGLSITTPLAASIGGTLLGVPRLATPDPREASNPAIGDSRTIDIDLGAVLTIDTLFLGYVFASAYPNATVTYGGGNYTQSAWPEPLTAAQTVGLPWRHYFSQIATPVQARYIRITITLPAGATIGVAMAGAAFIAFWGHEYGAGRPIADTGTATRLQAGGFGIDEGVATSGYSWTFGDLQPAETQALYLLMRNRRTTRSVLVCEDPDYTAGLNERLHYGLFNKLEAYERLNPLDTKWALQVADWI